MHEKTSSQRLALALVAVLTIAFLNSCSSTIYPPEAGVTSRFYAGENWNEVNLANYDFSRLSNDYGLCVFSYDFRGRGGNRITGVDDKAEIGVRVWEYQFPKGGWDVKVIEKRILFWGYPSMSALFLAREGYAIETRVTFHRGRIIYGGRLTLSLTWEDDPPPTVTMHFEEDMGPWMVELAQRAPDVKVDTAFLQIR